MRSTPSKKTKKTISGAEFDAMFDRGEDITPYVDFTKAVVVHRVNVDFPVWMIKRLDQEAMKLNISRQAVIKMWLADRMKASRPKITRSSASRE
jgi:hypothetical protein